MQIKIVHRQQKWIITKKNILEDNLFQCSGKCPLSLSLYIQYMLYIIYQRTFAQITSRAVVFFLYIYLFTVRVHKHRTKTTLTVNILPSKKA